MVLVNVFFREALYTHWPSSCLIVEFQKENLPENITNLPKIYYLLIKNQKRALLSQVKLLASIFD